MVAKDLYAVTFLAVDACNIYHGDIHTDVAHILCLLAVDEAVAMTVAEMAVQTVGIADRYGGDDAVVVDFALAAVATVSPAGTLRNWRIVVFNVDTLLIMWLLRLLMP